MHWLALLVPIAFLLTINRAQKPSPCPRVFKYDPQSTYESNRWYGEITVSTDDELKGVWLNIELDREVQLLLNWFGESMTSDNKEFILKNPSYILQPGPEISVHIGVIYNFSGGVPNVQRIKLNGRIVCPEKIRHNVNVTVFVNKPIGTALTHGLKMVNMVKNKNKGTDLVTLPNDPGQYNRFFTGNSYHTPSTATAIKLPISEEVHGVTSGNKMGGVEYYQGEITLGDEKGHVTNVGTTGAKERVPIVREQATFQCGTVRKRGTPLILHGQRAMEGTIDYYQGEWPWHTALYRSEGISLSYICGGSLITDRHVITAAHCVTKPHTTRPNNNHGLLVYLGSTNLRLFGPGIQVVQVKQCIVHPAYNATFLSNDLAIVRLGRRVIFTDYVRPICLWSGDVKLESVIGELGSVIGWGFDESLNLTENLQQAKMPVVASDTCIYSNPEFFSSFTSEKTFCAGFRNRTTVCNGDSGGGMVFLRDRKTLRGNAVWELRGLVSVGLAMQGQNVCDPSQYIVFTDVAKHLDWVKDILVTQTMEE